MSDIPRENNKRIAKNTLLLYIRMVFILAVNLYTSRVILKVLGIEDYGIYNVVAGVISMMGFFNGAMSTSTFRFLAIELGKNDLERLRKVFSICFSIYLLISLIFLLFAETIGLWFVNSYLVIPPERLTAANWIYQFAILSCVTSMLSNPYNAAIIARQKMHAYAYISIIEVILKLLIVYILYLLDSDKLIMYGALTFGVTFFVTLLYRLYAKRNFDECTYTFVKDRELFKSLFLYTGWNLLGSSSSIVKAQASNIFLNLFFGPILNASRAIAIQVGTAVNQFSLNFFTAIKPQITIYYAEGNFKEMHKLVFLSGKFSFYLMLIISMPVMLDTKYILSLWLGSIPEYSVVFIRLVIIESLIVCLENPLITSAHASGEVKWYQLSAFFIVILSIPANYFFFKCGFPPETTFFISILVASISLLIRVFIVAKLVSFSALDYLLRIILKVALVAILASTGPIIVSNMIKVDNLLEFIFVSGICLLSSVFFIYLFGLNVEEKKIVHNFITRKISNRHVRNKFN
ncbi:lipopolysaccharide biosynthesis protein [Sphingobacterium sp. LRF_L2]|uniref:lipopolysaccharide biosynthesis protein n=1 Tax=Sphingobacterium sp. LRF_L2 TaxID=3369421 RepID=UPI003F619B29